MLIRPLGLLLLTAMISAWAVDAVGDAGYLAHKLRPEWRLTPLQDVLDQIGKAAERPIERSSRVLEQQKDARVVLIARERWALADILGSLERTHGLRVEAGPLRLVVETEADARDRRRRAVQIDLAEFAIRATFPDERGRALGHAASGSSGGGFDLYRGADISESGADPEEVLDLLRASSEGAGLEARAHAAHLLVTPEEETLMRALLQEQYRMTVRRGTWRATFGLLAPGETIATGVVEPATANALAERLQQRHALTVSAFSNQMGNAGTLREQAVPIDAEVVNKVLDPTIQTLSTGRQFQVRALRGTHFDTLAYELHWVEPVAMHERAVRNPAGAEPGTVETRADAGKEKPTATAAVSATSATPGQRLTLGLPAVWTWAPRGDVILPHGQALVLCAPHGEHTAVIICAEVR
jgi:hypothetical protein